MKCVGLHQKMTRVGSFLILLLFFLTPSLSASIAAPPPVQNNLSNADLKSITIDIHGYVKDKLGDPIPSIITVKDKIGTEVGYLATDGVSYSIENVPADGKLTVSATPQALPDHFLEIDAGFQVSKYFELVKEIIPETEDIVINFEYPPAAALWLQAYTPEGSRLKFDDFNEKINPPGFWGLQGIYGVFGMQNADLPMPIEPNVGMLRAAFDTELDHSLWEPCFSVPSGEAVFLMMLWEVPGIGTFPLRADNQGLGYNLSVGEVRSINLVYEFAETEYRRAVELKLAHQSQGYIPSVEVLNHLDQAYDDLILARNQTNDQEQSLLSYDILLWSIKAKEVMAMEMAEKGIQARYNDLSVILKDTAGVPISGATVNYVQTESEFIISRGHNLPTGNFLFPSYKATKEMGFEYVYDVALVWKDTSPAPGVYDFSKHDADLERAQVEGWKVVSCLGWLGRDNVPDWAANLEFDEFKIHMSDFVKKAVEHYSGKVKYLIISIEPTIQTQISNRYVDIAIESSYTDGLTPEELIDLIRTAFDAARDVESDLSFGISVVPDYGYFELNSFGLAGRPSPYAFLSDLLDSGVHPDWIGVEMNPGTATIPLDLSTVASIFEAYHDLSGLPILIVEMSSYPTRTEDYGNSDPVPDVYWHEGMTQAVQSEWDTSVFKLAMGQPDVFGLQLLTSNPDNNGGVYAQIPSDCNEIEPYACVGIGSDFLTYDYQRKEVYDALKDLFSSWRGKGVAVTDSKGQVNFKGLSGTYEIRVTTADGLSLIYNPELNSLNESVSLTFDKARAISDLQNILSSVQKALMWSQSLGRDLDYTTLNAQLAVAKTAFSLGDYGNARSISQQVLDAVTINIDGSADDWLGIPPIATLPEGEVLFEVPGTDLKALYGMVDDKFLYLMLEVYDPPIKLQLDGNVDGIDYPYFPFPLQTGINGGHWVSTYLPYTGQLDLDLLSDPEKKLAVLYTMAYNNVMEMKITLDLLGNPSKISASAYVLAVKETGLLREPTGVKGFEGFFDVLVPIRSIFLPLISNK